MLEPKLRFAAFIALFHPTGENLTFAIARDLDVDQWMNPLAYAWIAARAHSPAPE